jgi:hypothetical protein
MAIKPPSTLRPTFNRLDGAHRKRQDAYNAWMKSLVENIDATDITEDSMIDKQNLSDEFKRTLIVSLYRARLIGGGRLLNESDFPSVQSVVKEAHEHYLNDPYFNSDVRAVCYTLARVVNESERAMTDEMHELRREIRRLHNMLDIDIR